MQVQAKVLMELWSVFSAGFLSTSMPCTAATAEAGSVLPLINWFIDSGSPMVAMSRLNLDNRPVLLVDHGVYHFTA